VGSPNLKLPAYKKHRFCGKKNPPVFGGLEELKKYLRRKARAL